MIQFGKVSLQTNPKRQRGRTLNSSRFFASPSLALFEVTQFSREATVADSCGRQPAEIGGIEFKAAERRQQFVDAVAASRLCVPFPLLSVGFRPRLSAFAASAAENCATSKLALRVTFVGQPLWIEKLASRDKSHRAMEIENWKVKNTKRMTFPIALPSSFVIPQEANNSLFHHTPISQ
jgi:hypothetical protein